MLIDELTRKISKRVDKWYVGPQISVALDGFLVERSKTFAFLLFIFLMLIKLIPIIIVAITLIVSRRDIHPMLCVVTGALEWEGSQRLFVTYLPIMSGCYELRPKTLSVVSVDPSPAAFLRIGNSSPNVGDAKRKDWKQRMLQRRRYQYRLNRNLFDIFIYIYISNKYSHSCKYWDIPWHDPLHPFLWFFGPVCRRGVTFEVSQCAAGRMFGSLLSPGDQSCWMLFNDIVLKWRRFRVLLEVMTLIIWISLMIQDDTCTCNVIKYMIKYNGYCYL